jgi:hypothetical protein
MSARLQVVSALPKCPNPATRAGCSPAGSLERHLYPPAESRHERGNDESDGYGQRDGANEAEIGPIGGTSDQALVAVVPRDGGRL